MEPEHNKKLIAVAVEAKKNALALYSHFPVGAALMTKYGTIYSGINIESSSYGLTICAERVALFKALSEGEREFEAIAIATDTDEFCSPCGACRQVLWEFASTCEIILVNRKIEKQIHGLKDLLPNAFDNQILLKNSK